MKAVLDAVAKQGTGFFIFLVNLRRGENGHTIGIHLPFGRSGLHFFDSNFGEFAFPDSFEQDRQSFLDDWSKLYRNPAQHWALEGVTRRSLKVPVNVAKES
jgi:hypothetical protein